MKARDLIFSLVLLFTNLITVSAQLDYAVKAIDADLVENAAAVIRKMDWTLELKDIDELNVVRHEVITVFNRRGLSSLNPLAPYDDFTTIKKIEATLYDKNGRELQKFKKKDFADVSASGSNMYTDNRLLILDLAPQLMPFTFEIEVSYRTSTTAYLPAFNPSPNYYVSTESASFRLENPKQIQIRTQEFKLDEFNIQKVEDNNSIEYRVTNILPMEPEPYSPYFTEFSPFVQMVPVKFNLGGEITEIQSWDDFANWQNTSLLAGRDKLSKKTLEEVTQLVADVDDPEEKARLIYSYVQDKTRYISVQVGLGGWQPAPAMEVDRLGYGDCKALTNYTLALLKSQGITSYYTIVDAGVDGRDIDEDHIALQGNHVILTVPFEDETVFLECTSQKVPYNFLGSHTDNRKVLAITPEGASILRTHPYPAEQNSTDLKASITFDDNLVGSGTIVQVSKGLSYGAKYELPNYSEEDLNQYYRETWGHLSRVELNEINFEDDRKEINFTESIAVNFSSYVNKAGDMVLLNPNIFTRQTYIPDHNPNRTLPLEIRRGYTYNDFVEIGLPNTYELNSEFEQKRIENKFGTYSADLTISEDGILRYSRQLIFLPGKFDSNEYEAYIDFIKEIVIADKQVVALKSK